MGPHIGYPLALGWSFLPFLPGFRLVLRSDGLIVPVGLDLTQLWLMSTRLGLLADPLKLSFAPLNTVVLVHVPIHRFALHVVVLLLRMLPEAFVYLVFDVLTFILSPLLPIRILRKDRRLVYVPK